MKKIIFLLVMIMMPTFCFAETVENYLATFEVIEEAVARSDTISVDQDLYDAFSEQLELVDDQIDLLVEPVDLSDPDETDLYNNFINCQSSLASVGEWWSFAIQFYGTVEPDKIEFFLNSAEDAKSVTVLNLDAAWGNYYQVDFARSGGTDPGSGGSETEKDYLTTFEAIEEAVARSDTISVDQDLYDAFSEQLELVDDQIGILVEPVDPFDSDETDLYNYFINCQSSLASVGEWWSFAIQFYGTVEPDKIASYLKSAEEANSIAALNLDAAWGNYYQIDFPRLLGGGGDGDSDGDDDGGGGSGPFSCFITSVLY